MHAWLLMPMYNKCHMQPMMCMLQQQPYPSPVLPKHMLAHASHATHLCFEVLGQLPSLTRPTVTFTVSPSGRTSTLFTLASPVRAHGVACACAWHGVA